MAKAQTKAKPKPKQVDQVDEFFDRIETFVQTIMQEPAPPLKIQIERDRRGKPVLGVRVRAEDVDPEMMETLRYPQ